MKTLAQLDAAFQKEIKNCEWAQAYTGRQYLDMKEMFMRGYMLSQYESVPEDVSKLQGTLFT